MIVHRWSGKYIPRLDTKMCFLRCLGNLKNLTLLALEYSHIADGTGDALTALTPIIKKTHFQLQLICREDHTPGLTDAALGGGGYSIPDTTWRAVSSTAPNLYLLISFYRIRDYDNVRRFLSPSIPLREVHLTYGIDLKTKQRQDSDLSCFIRHVTHYYGHILVTLSIHQWRFATFPLRRILQLIPRLTRLQYVGKLEDDIDVKRILQIVACGACEKLKELNIQIQTDVNTRAYWSQVVEKLIEEYSQIMCLYNINLCLSVYKS
ncbi:hypothetical protein ACJJTC_000589 [Scirpophaga incertulas]